MLWDNLSASVENDYIDFKREWYTKDKLGEVDLVHDILCMSNSLSDSVDRYIVIGVEEDKFNGLKIMHDVSSDVNCRQSANLIQTLRNYMSVTPKIEIIREQTDNIFIDIIKITPSARDLPYVLNKECQAQKSDGKKVTVKKEWIYSRNSDRNTPKDECCTKAELEELFARKHGEHLPILDRFSMYLDDIENWKRPKKYYSQEVSEDACYYLKNHKFKIVLRDTNYNEINFIKNAIDYWYLVTNTALNEDYWEHRGAAYDDNYKCFNVELWADNTLIEVRCITSIYLKYYLHDKHITDKRSFFVPSIEYLYEKTKKQIEQTIEWKVCKLLFVSELEKNSNYSVTEASKILDILNYEYLADSAKYLKQNESWVFMPNSK